MKRLLLAALTAIGLTVSTAACFDDILSPTATVYPPPTPQPTATPEPTPRPTATPVPCAERVCTTSEDCCPQPVGAPEACVIDPVSGQGRCRA